MCLAVRKIHVFFKLKQDFLKTGRDNLLIQIMNDSSDDTNIKIIQLSKLYLYFTSFSFTSRVFPSSINVPAETIFFMELLGFEPHFIIDDINYQINSSVCVANGDHYCATLIKIHIQLITFDQLVYKEIQLSALMLMTSSTALPPELRIVTRDCYFFSL